jgi:hypothetical protein
MAIHDGTFRPWFHDDNSYSSIIGIEITLPPEMAIHSAEEISQYTHKALPPIPVIPTRSPNRPKATSPASEYSDMPSQRRFSSLDAMKEAHQGSIRKIAQLTGHTLDIDISCRTKVVQLTGHNLSLLNQDYLPSLQRLFGYYTPDESKEDSVQELDWSDTASTKSSQSIYSREVSGEIAESINKWSSWTPSKSSLASPAEGQLYLQPGKYNANANELQLSNYVWNRQLEPLSLRHRDRPVRASMVDLSVDSSGRKEITLRDLVEDEREHMEIEERRDIQASRRDKVVEERSLELSSRDRPRRSLAPGHTNDYISPMMTTALHSGRSNINDDTLSTSGYPDPECYQEIIRSLTPAALQIYPKSTIEDQRCVSRFSEHSSVHEFSRVSNARDSVISHMRSIPTPFRTSSKAKRPMPHIGHLHLQSASSPPAGQKDKSDLSGGKHSLKTPLPSHGRPSKSSVEANEKSPKTLEDKPKESTRSFMLRFSNAIKHLSGGRESSSMIIHQDRIIPNNIRRNDGPDTPLPRKTSNVHVPAFITGISGAKIPTNSVFHGSVFPNSVFRKSTAGIADAVEVLADTVDKAKKRAKIKNNEERRRDKLRKQIFFVGPADQGANGVVTMWF